MSEAPTVLPEPYATWMQTALGAPVPPEPLATCDDCAMCVPDAERTASRSSYDPAVKCCSFVPVLPNFRAGALLLSVDATWERGRETLRQRIRAGQGITPLGVGRPPRDELLYEHGRAGFGSAKALLCPHYLRETGLCGIWPFRDAVCATWFCKVERGEVGFRFWKLLRHLLQQAESAINHGCVLEEGLEGEGLEALLANDESPSSPRGLNAAALDNRPEPEALRKVWGSWYGREEAYYEACARRAATLSWERVCEIAGPRLRLLEKATQGAFAALVSERVPDWVRVGQYTVNSATSKRTCIVGPLPRQSIDIPRVILDLLPELEGRPVNEALGFIARKHNVRLSPTLIRKLTDYGILCEVPSRSSDEAPPRMSQRRRD